MANVIKALEWIREGKSVRRAVWTKNQKMFIVNQAYGAETIVGFSPGFNNLTDVILDDHYDWEIYDG